MPLGLLREEDSSIVSLDEKEEELDCVVVKEELVSVVLNCSMIPAFLTSALICVIVKEEQPPVVLDGPKILFCVGVSALICGKKLVTMNRQCVHGNLAIDVLSKNCTYC